MPLTDPVRGLGRVHEDWDDYDQVKADEDREAAFVEPTRCSAQGLGGLLSGHLEVTTALIYALLR